MSLLQEIQKIPIKSIKKRIPKLQSGFTVKVHQKIKEGNKERVQVFEGLIIKINSGHGADKSFTVRKIVGGIGVEKIFPLYSPKIEKIEVVKKSKVRRAKLYYMRDRSGKSARLKEEFINREELENSYDNEAILEAEAAALAEQKEKEAAEEAKKQEEEKASTPEAPAAEKPAPEDNKKEEASNDQPAEKPTKEEKSAEAPKEEAKKQEDTPKEDPKKE